MSLFSKMFQSKSVKTKSTTGIPKHVQFLFDTFGTGIIHEFISPIISYQFYHKISPLQGTIGKIATAISELPLVLRSEDDPEEITKKSEVLDILNTPSPLQTKKQFLNDIAISSMLTREIWVMARGPINKSPIELVFVHPYNVNIQSDLQNMWPSKIEVTIPGEHKTFFRNEVSGGRFRYFDKIEMNELFPYISENNDVSGVATFRGTSKLTSLKDELLSYASSIIGNTASTENSGRPSGVLTPEDELDEIQWEQLVKSLENAEGSINSGRLMVLPARVKAIFQRWAPKDMDYETLQKNVKMNIWRLYSMPLPIVNETGQTFNNFKTAQVAFYDEAVNQAWSSISDALKWMMITRFESELEGFRIGYNAFEVPTLRRRAIEQMEIMNKSNVLKTNEIRRSAGFDEITEGDDVIVTASQAPLSSVIEGASFNTSIPESNGK